MYSIVSRVPCLRRAFDLYFVALALRMERIDVQDFAPALLAAGELMQSANDVINKDNAKVSVKIRATSEGSFEVDLSLWQQIVDSIFTVSKENRDGITAADELAALVLKSGGIAAGCGGGLIALLKWLKGRKPEKIEETGGCIHIHIGDQIFTTNKKAVALAENIEVRKQARKLVSALDRDGIDSIGICQDGCEEINIGRQDVRSFDIPEDDEEEIAGETRMMTLQIISLSF